MTVQTAHSRPLAILALFAALAIAGTWPLATVLSSRIAFDPGDPFLNTWILWWNAQAAPFTSAWWSPPIFYPMPGALALSEHLAGIAVLTTPLIRLGGSPVLAYNAAFLLSYTLSGFFTYLLVKRLTGSDAAAFCAGLAYAFAPFRAGQLSHLQVLTSQWLPLQLLGLHLYVETRRRRHLATFAAAWILQGLSNGYYLLFAPALIGVWVCWFAGARRQWRVTMAIGAAWTLASLPLVPILFAYRRIHTSLGLGRSGGEILGFSGHLGSFANPPYMLAFWPPRAVPTVEDFLFPGVTVLVIIAAALVLTAWRTRPSGVALRGTLLFYVLAALLMAALTLGPAGPDDGVLGWVKPYQLLVHLPGFNGLRVPVRYAMLMALCLAVAAGIGLSMLQAAFGWTRLFLGAAALGIALDGWMDPVGSSRPPGRVDLPEVPAAAVLELPPDDATVSVGAMFRSMTHRRPLVNGYSGYIPPHYAILSASLRRRDPSAVVELARGRPLLMLIAERHDPGGDFRRLIESIPGVEHRGVTTAGIAYVLPAQPHKRRPRGGTPLPFSVGWLPRSHVVLDLKSSHVVRNLEFPLRRHYPSLGRRIAIEVSEDGATWKTALEDWTGGTALAGALEDQVLVPIRFTLPDISARYLRIHPAEDWMTAELSVYGP